MQPDVTTAPATPEPITDWAILEIMGHERLAGQSCLARPLRWAG